MSDPAPAARVRHDLDLFVSARPAGVVGAERRVVGRYVAWEDGRWSLWLPGLFSEPFTGDTERGGREALAALLAHLGRVWADAPSSYPPAT